MRIRKPGAWGRSFADFHNNIPDAPALAVVYRLNLSVGEWWLDLAEGTPWQTEVVGERTTATRDPAIKARILGTQGIVAIAAYDSILDRELRAFVIETTIDTVYSTGPTTIEVALP